MREANPEIDFKFDCKLKRKEIPNEILFEVWHRAINKDYKANLYRNDLVGSTTLTISLGADGINIT